MAGTALLGGLSQPPRLEWRAARVVDSWTETPRVRTLALEVPEWPGHRAGQHVDLRLTAEDGYQAQRSYSISSAPGTPRVEVTVEYLSDGEVSPYLVDVARVDDLIEVRGPIGGYFVWAPEPSRPLALVAGGSGVAPLMSMLRHRATLNGATESVSTSGREGAHAAVPPARLLFSARSFEDLIYRVELDRLAEADPDLRIAYTLTRAHPDDWSGFDRRIDRDMLREVFWPASAKPVFYVCGPTPMVEAVASLLVDLDYPPADVRTERFGPTGG